MAKAHDYKPHPKAWDGKTKQMDWQHLSYAPTPNLFWQFVCEGS